METIPVTNIHKVIYNHQNKEQEEKYKIQNQSEHDT